MCKQGDPAGNNADVIIVLLYFDADAQRCSEANVDCLLEAAG
jgi:hypothetical protein